VVFFLGGFALDVLADVFVVVLDRVGFIGGDPWINVGGCFGLVV